MERPHNGVVIEYDDAKHLYHLVHPEEGRVRVPSVTQVVKVIQNYRGGNEEAKARGTAVHNAVMLLEGGGDGTGLGSCPEEIIPYVEAYRLFKKESHWICAATEAMAASWKYKVACRFDQEGSFPRRSKPALLELKTGSQEPWHAVQLAGQRICLEETSPRDRYSLNLMPNGRYKLKKYADEGDRATFLSCLAVTHWRGRVYGYQEDGT